MAFREIKLFIKNPNVEIASGVECDDNNVNLNYTTIVEAFSKYPDEFYNKVWKIYIQFFDKEQLSDCFGFAREVAFHYDAIVEFIRDGATYNVSKQTPEDWLDMSYGYILRCQDKEDRVFGPDYLDLSVEEMKEVIMESNYMVQTYENMILKHINKVYEDPTIDYHSFFESYEAYKSWASWLYTGIFIEQRKMKYYIDQLSLKQEYVSEADVAEFMERKQEELARQAEEQSKKNIQNQ